MHKKGATNFSYKSFNLPAVKLLVAVVVEPSVYHFDSKFVELHFVEGLVSIDH